MPRWLLVVLGLFGAAVGIVIAIGLFLPDAWRIERSIVVDAPPRAVYAEVGDLARWPHWAPWRNEVDPSLEFTYGERTEGPGATLAWHGDQLGRGTLTITRSEPDAGVWYEMRVPRQASRAEGAITFEREGDGTRVTWTDHGDLGGDFAGRYFIPVLERAMGAQFQQGLERLRTRVEGAAEAAKE